MTVPMKDYTIIVPLFELEETNTQVRRKFTNPPLPMQGSFDMLSVFPDRAL